MWNLSPVAELEKASRIVMLQGLIDIARMLGSHGVSFFGANQQKCFIAISESQDVQRHFDNYGVLDLL